MYRATIALLLIMSPAFAWEAKLGSVCSLTHEGETASVQVTYDQNKQEYAIAITPKDGWGGGPAFAMRFEGPAELTITTDRHVLSDNNRTLIVRDSGFGNVLNGLEFNETANAILGEQTVSVSLEGAAPEVQKFRACAESIGV